MICKGTTHNNGVRLAKYMITGKAGERAELGPMRGFEATNIIDAFRDIQIMSGATNCTQPFFHVQVRNREDEQLTRAQWEEAADRIEQKLGLADQPRAIAFHIDEKTGHEHMHVAWSRIDEETLTARPLPFFKDRLKKISRELEGHFGLGPVRNEREDTISYAPTRAEDEQARRLGLDIHAIRTSIRACYERSDCGAAFAAALAAEGFVLARGEKRDFIVLDQAGGMHALGKRLLDATAARVRDRLSDLSREDLPSVDMARELIAAGQNAGKQKDTGREEERAPHWDRDFADQAWQDSIVKAAIEREKREREFVEPAVKRERQVEPKTAAAPERPLNEQAAAIRLSYSLSATPQEFLRNLDDCGFRLACVTKEEAERSYRKAAFARETGRFAPDFREGEFVAVSEHGFVYGLNQRTAGESRAEVSAFLRTLDKEKIAGIEATKLKMATQKRAGRPRDLWNEDFGTVSQSFEHAASDADERKGAPDQVRGVRAEIWNAYARSDNARAFAAALEGQGISLAVATRDDVANCSIDQHHATQESRLFPRNLKEGDFVAVTPDAWVFNLNRTTTGESAERVRRFLSTLDRSGYSGVYDALNSAREKGAQLEFERQAFRDLSRGGMEKPRDLRPTGRLASETLPKLHATVDATAEVGKKTTRSVVKSLDLIGGALGAVFAPILTPEQKAEGERTEKLRKMEANQTIDYRRYTTELQREREQEDQAARDRERDGRER